MFSCYYSSLVIGLIILAEAVTLGTVFCLIMLLLISLLFFKFCIRLVDKLMLRTYRSVYERMHKPCSTDIGEEEPLTVRERLAIHDMKQHYISLLGMLQRHDYEKAETYLSHLLEENQKGNGIVNTGNVIVDTMINAKYPLMNELHMDCFVDIHIPMELPFEESDLSILLGNLLDNAIEANYGDIPNKYVKIYMVFDKNILIVTVINSYGGKLVKDKAGRILTGKRDKGAHGFGLLAIERIARKYHGSVRTEDSLEEFKIELILMADGK